MIAQPCPRPRQAAASRRGKEYDVCVLASFIGNGISAVLFVDSAAIPAVLSPLLSPPRNIRCVQSRRIVEKLNTDWKLVFLTLHDEVNVARNFHNSPWCPGLREFRPVRETNSDSGSTVTRQQNITRENAYSQFIFLYLIYENLISFAMWSNYHLILWKI